MRLQRSPEPPSTNGTNPGWSSPGGKALDDQEEHHLFRGPINDGDALAVEVNWFRQIYNTIRPHQALGDRTPRDAHLAGQ